MVLVTNPNPPCPTPTPNPSPNPNQVLVTNQIKHPDDARYHRMQARYREIWGDTGKSSGIQGDIGRDREMQIKHPDDARYHRMQARYRET